MHSGTRIIMNIAALFAGIGGMERGLHEAGHETMLTCEIWDPAVTVLGISFRSSPTTPTYRAEIFPRQDGTADGWVSRARICRRPA